MKIVLILLLAGIAPASSESIPITWKTLSDVRFTKRKNEEVGMYFLYPTFGDKVKALKGKTVKIKGYMIPIDEEGRTFVLSEQPMAMCFFCGGAGPESIIELEFRKNNLRFKTDEVRTISGKLQLNPKDINHLNYILTNASAE